MDFNKVGHSHNVLILRTYAFVSVGAPVCRINRLLVAGDEKATT